MIVIKDINKWIHTIILIGKAAYSKYSVWTILQKEFIKFCLIRTQVLMSIKQMNKTNMKETTKCYWRT